MSDLNIETQMLNDIAASEVRKERFCERDENDNVIVKKDKKINAQSRTKKLDSALKNDRFSDIDETYLENEEDDVIVKKKPVKKPKSKKEDTRTLKQKMSSLKNKIKQISERLDPLFEELKEIESEFKKTHKKKVNLKKAEE